MTRRGPKPKGFWAYVDKTPTCWLWMGGRREYGHGLYSVTHGEQVGDSARQHHSWRRPFCPERSQDPLCQWPRVHHREHLSATGRFASLSNLRPRPDQRLAAPKERERLMATIKNISPDTRSLFRPDAPPVYPGDEVTIADETFVRYSWPSDTWEVVEPPVGYVAASTADAHLWVAAPEAEPKPDKKAETPRKAAPVAKSKED